ncbi:MAG: hypothetical protein ACLP7W_08670, partial [Solirubrobacteraceae bacterium]
MVELKRCDTAAVSTTDAYPTGLFDKHLLDLSSSAYHCFRPTLETSVTARRPALEVRQAMLQALTLYNVHGFLAHIARFTAPLATARCQSILPQP